MTTKKNFYHTLGLLPAVDDVVIKAAYKALAQKYHPDKHKSNKELQTQMMASLNEAYAAIGTKDKRKAYDASLARVVVKPDSPKPAAKADSSQDDLLQQFENGAMDEMAVVAAFEKLFSKNIHINAGWVNTYTYVEGSQKLTLGFTELKLKIVQKLKQH